MRLGIPLVIALAAMFAHAPASACKQLIPNAKLRISDVVVEGTAHCLERPSVCKLSINNVIKGDPLLANTEVEIRVDDARPARSADDTIIVTRCPQSFEPLEASTEGRFYLTGSVEAGLYAAHPVDKHEETAEIMR